MAPWFWVGDIFVVFFLRKRLPWNTVNIYFWHVEETWTARNKISEKQAALAGKIEQFHKNPPANEERKDKPMKTMNWSTKALKSINKNIKHIIFTIYETMGIHWEHNRKQPRKHWKLTAKTTQNLPICWKAMEQISQEETQENNINNWPPAATKIGSSSVSCSLARQTTFSNWVLNPKNTMPIFCEALRRTNWIHLKWIQAAPKKTLSNQHKLTNCRKLTKPNEDLNEYLNEDLCRTWCHPGGLGAKDLGGAPDGGPLRRPWYWVGSLESAGVAGAEASQEAARLLSLEIERSQFEEGVFW